MTTLITVLVVLVFAVFYMFFIACKSAMQNFQQGFIQL